MRVLRDSSAVPPNAKGCVVALGNFDGLHLGHQAVIAEAAKHAKVTGKPLAIMTFEPHPRRIFRPDLPLLRLLPMHEKIQRMRELGVEYLRVIRFTRDFATTSANDFVRIHLHEMLGASHIVTGDDFTFGHNREGNATSLRQDAASLGMTTMACPQLTVDGERSSSTRIRGALIAGDVKLAAMLLGRSYSITAPVRHGDKRGRELGFPTANLLPPPIFLPKFGVYAVHAKLGGQVISGVANLGIRPDYPLKNPLLEVYLFDWKDEIYGQKLNVEFVKFLRPEEKFSDVEALKAQMAKDCEQARAILR